ncbi:LCP family protein [uncultured Jatrophihabitans sp.]|uniref:LCP family protein n=1 Tax=uncultured Jatrophihabitans sp. TaxID=1610747 RepID=UPI0035CAE918
MRPDLSGRPPVAARPGRPRWGIQVGLRAAVAVASLLVLVVSGVAWATFKNFTATVPHGSAVPADLRDPDGADQNILLVGDDTRAGATRAELKALHTGHDITTANADTMMILHVPANGSRPTLVSFPRDSWVTIPGHGKGKLNAAYPDGFNAAKAAHESEQQAESAGLILTIRTLHALTGLHIDHYMQVNLLGFYRISVAIGGVKVCLNAAQNKTTDRDAYGSGYSGIDLPKGVSVIEGKQALAFVRQRHGLPHGDLDRIKRQQYFLKSAFEKITTAGTLLNPFKIRDLLQAVGQSLLTDPQLDLLSLARQFESLTSGKIAFATIPNNGPKLIYPDGVETSIVQVNTSAIPAFVQQLEGKGDAAYMKAKPAAPASVTVDVLNGTSTPRLAARNAEALKKLGFRINTVDSTTTTPKTVVEYPPGREGQAKAVVRDVPRATAVPSPDVARVTLVLGADGRQVRGLATPAATATTASPTATTAKPADPTTGLGCID